MTIEKMLQDLQKMSQNTSAPKQEAVKFKKRK